MVRSPSSSVARKLRADNRKNQVIRSFFSKYDLDPTGKIDRMKMKGSRDNIASIASGRVFFYCGCVLLLLTVFLLYRRVFTFGFVYDDDLYVRQNPLTLRGITPHTVLRAFMTIHAGNWQPITMLSHMMDVTLFGAFAGGHHMINIVLHAFNVALLFFLLRKLTFCSWKSFIVAALFAYHPLHVESVAWISERKDLLCTFFWFLSLSMYTDYARTHRFRDYLFAVLFFSLGLMSKPMIVTLPLQLLLIDIWPLKRLNYDEIKMRFSIPRLLREKTAFFFLSAVACFITLWAQASAGAVGSLGSYPLLVRTGNALISYVEYIEKTLLPFGLAAFYPYPQIPLDFWRIALAGTFVLLVTGIGIKFLKKAPFFIVGWLWYVVTLVPVIGLIQVGGQAMADRYTYVPSIGLYIIGVWGGSILLVRTQALSKVRVGATVMVLATLWGMSWVQITHWKDEISLFRNAAAVTTNNYVALNNLSVAYLEAGRPQEALLVLTEALRMRQDYATTHYNLGSTLSATGRNDEACHHYDETLRINSTFPKARYNLATNLLLTGKHEEAIVHYQAVLVSEPRNAEAHNNLGVLLANQGQLDQAIRHFGFALEQNSFYEEARNNLRKVIALRKQGPP